MRRSFLTNGLRNNSPELYVASFRTDKYTPFSHEHVNNPTATQDNAGVRRALIRFVNDIESVCHTKVYNFQQKQQHGNYAVQQVCIHMNLTNSPLRLHVKYRSIKESLGSHILSKNSSYSSSIIFNSHTCHPPHELSLSTLLARLEFDYIEKQSKL